MKKLLSFVVFVFLFSNHSFAGVKEASDFVNKTSSKTLSIVADKKLSDKEKEQQLNDLFIASMDINWIGRFVTGRYWRDATDSQKEQYMEVYQKFLMSSYVPKFREYTNQKIEFKNVEEERDGEYLVQTEIQRPGAPPIRIDYKLKEKQKGQFEIYDIVAEGISLITTQRSDFATLLSRGGMKSLINKLEEKLNASK